MGKEKNEYNLNKLLEIFNLPAPIEIRREIVSSIGRQNNNDKVYIFMGREAFNDKNPMDLIYQIFRTCLYKSKTDKRFLDLKGKIIEYYQNEI